MRIAIVGGTGTLGRAVTEQLRARGHDIRVLSRHAPEYRVDLATGEGLDTALAGCDVVIDASNDNSKTAESTLVEGTKKLLAAEAAASVKHHVGVSIVGCDQVPIRYFRVKTAQERAVESGSVPWTIVRATQFHELISTALAAASRFGLMPLPRGTLQTVAVEDAARAIATVAEQAPQRRRVLVTGPERNDLRDLAKKWRASAHRRVLFLPMPLPGPIGEALRGGALTAESPDIRGTTSFNAWLEARAAGAH
jgi:uncharacterized protein YbjT (DUF2867 family)